MAAMAKIAAEPGYIASRNGRAAIKFLSAEDFGSYYQYELRSRMMEHWSQPAHEQAAPFGRLHWAHSRLGASDDRPASEVAARWLHDDLKALSLSDGTFPNLHR